MSAGTPSTEFNPYQVPLAAVEERPDGHPQDTAGQPSSRMVELLRGTGPWVLFLAIMGFISTAFMALSGLTTLVMIPVMGSVGEGSDGAAGLAMFAIVTVTYLGGAVVAALVAWHMVRYYQSINRATRTGTTPDVEGAFSAQHRLWRMIGLTTIVSVAGGLLAGVLFMVFAVAMVSSSLGGS